MPGTTTSPAVGLQTRLARGVDDTTFVARLLGWIDLFRIWWILNLSVGLGVLYKVRTRPIATGLLGVYAALALIIAGVITARAGV